MSGTLSSEPLPVGRPPEPNQPARLPLEGAGEWGGACSPMSPAEQTSCLETDLPGDLSPHSLPGEEALSMTTGLFLGLGGVRRLMLPGSASTTGTQLCRQLCLNLPYAWGCP